MAINTYRFWMATDTNRLLANQNSFIQASAPAFYQGNVANLELFMVTSAGVGLTPVDVPFPAGVAISVAVGDTNTYPTGGTWELMVDTTETEPMPYNATTAQVSTALNALSEVSSAGGLTVSKTGDGYTITWNTYGSKPSIGIGSDTLTPSSYESISLVQQGDSQTRQIVFVELRQNPIALGVDWNPLDQPSINVTEIQAWNGVSRIWRVSIAPQPKAGTITISYGAKTATLAYNASSSVIAAALTPAQVFATGQYQWDILISEDSVLTAVGNLIGYNGYSGSINFSTSECHQFLAGAEKKSTTLEVSISVNSKRYTLIQTPCNVFADVISDGVLEPLPLGTAMSEQVANARFVRRDTTQSPTATELNNIWLNLGVSKFGTDVSDALSGSQSPGPANPFATLADIPSVIPAQWGNITGAISDQTDLQNALDDKYDATNPNGYISSSTVDSFYLKKSGGVITGTLSSLNGSGFSSSDGLTGSTLSPGTVYVYGSSGAIEIKHYQIKFPDNTIQTTAYNGGAISAAWGNITGTLSDQTDLQAALDGKYDTSNPAGYIDLSYLSGYATESWVLSQGYITSGAITDMATIPWVNSQNYTTLEAAQDWVNSQGYLSFDTFGRLSFPGGTNPDQYPIPGRFWFQSDKFRYSTNYSSLGNVVASEGWCDAKFQTLAGMSSYLTTSAASTTYLTQTNAASTYQTQSGMLSYAPLASPTFTGTVTIPSGASIAGYLTSTTAASTYQTLAGMSSYAQLAGASFTGKVNFVPASADSPSINIGSANSVPANAQNGDVWISNVASPKLAYRTGNTNYYAVVANAFNTFTGQVAVSGTSASIPQLQVTQAGSAPALRVTSTGTGHAIVVEDSTTPDSTSTIIDQNGNLGVGVDASTWTASNKVEIVGAVKAQSITFDGSAQFKVNSVTSHGTGATTHDLLISFNGSTYRVPMIFVSTP